MKILKKLMTPRKKDKATCEISSLAPLTLEPTSCSSLESLAATIAEVDAGRIRTTKAKACLPGDGIGNVLCSSPNNRSLGSGSFSSLGSVSYFTPSPTKNRVITATLTSPSKRQQRQEEPTLPSMGTATRSPVVFTRRLSSFLRVADLQMDQTMWLHSSGSIEGSNPENDNDNHAHPNFHHVAVNPPPGVPEEPMERWVVLDDGEGMPAPIARYAVAALAKMGLQTALDKQMWTAADSKTKSLVAVPGWHECTWNAKGCVEQSSYSNSRDQQLVLVWTGSFQHGHYGSALPAVRTAGFIQMSPSALTELLVDSSRCTEYNKLSVGRTDLLVLQEKMSKLGAFGGITKVMKSESRPPLLRKTLQFISILHATELSDGSGYLIVSRAVTTPEDEEKLKLQNVLKSEILMGVNIIKRVEGDDNRCLLIAVNHIRSPMVPMMIAKRLGLQAAQNFIQDLRACAATATATAQE